jgi:hypothetical protein
MTVSRDPRRHDAGEECPRPLVVQKLGQERPGERPEQADEKIDPREGEGEALRLLPWRHAEAIARCRRQRDRPDLGIDPLEQHCAQDAPGCLVARCGRSRPCPPELHRHPADPGRREACQDGPKHRLAGKDRSDAEPGQASRDPDAKRHAGDMRQCRAEPEPRARRGQEDHVRTRREEPEKNEDIERVHHPRPQDSGAPKPLSHPLSSASDQPRSSFAVARNPPSIQRLLQPFQFIAQRGTLEPGHQVGGLHRENRPCAGLQRRDVLRVHRPLRQRAAQQQDIPRQPRAVPIAEFRRRNSVRTHPSSAGAPAPAPRPATGGARR